ncbi:MAG: acyl-CoA thioesterase [Lachnospiraceae bacterium]|nr:acyl-CoA thioesterase [Lachnospiraceae bacterium]
MNSENKHLYTHTVQYYETDRMQVTHHSNYIRWMEEARVAFLHDIGWDYEKLEEKGVFSPVIRVDVSYKNSTTFADVVEVYTWVKEFRGVKLVIGYEMKKQDGTLVCEAVSEHCFLNSEGKPVRVNREMPEFYEALQP